MSSTKPLSATLKRQINEREELLQLGQTIFSLSLDETLNQIITVAVKITGAEQGNVLVFEPKTHSFLSQASLGVPKGKLVRIEIPSDSDTPPSSITEWVVRNQKSALISNLKQPPWSNLYQELEKGKHSLSELTVPIRGSREATRQVIGIINLESPRKNAFDEDHRILMELLAQLAAVAIRNAEHAQILKLIREIDHKISSTFDPQIILERIADGVLEMIGAPYVVVYSYSERTNRLEARAVRGISKDKLIPIQLPSVSEVSRVKSKGIVGWAITNKKPVLIKNLAEEPRWSKLYIHLANEIAIRSELLVPILWGKQKEILGAINLESQQASAFDEDDKNRLLLLAGQAAIALHNARAYQRERHTARTLDIIREIDLDIAKLSVFNELGTVVNRVADGIQELIPTATMLNIYARHEDQQALVSRALRGFSEDRLVKLEIPVDAHDDEEKGVLRWVVRNKRSALVKDALHEENWKDIYIELAQGQPSRSELAVPVMWGTGEILGIINIESTEPGVFNEQDQKDVELLAGQVAIVIHNMEVEKKQMQLNVERQRMDMLKLFAITSAHRMANDVGTIPVAAKEIERLINAEEPDRDAILMHARRIAVDARRLMDQAQKVRKPIAVHDPQSVNVHETIQRALNGTETRFPEIILSVDLTARHAICKANFLMLTDVFKNLIDNAIEAMSEKGSLTISSEIVEQDGENKIKINVTDTGPGIQPRHQEHLFDPFFTTKEGKGMGIGLFWTKNFLEQDAVRGSLDYETEVGKGTTFIITLPLADSK